MEEIDNSNVSTHLGKVTGYASQYDAELLVREPRQSNRDHLDIQGADLPFEGFDVWNAYEVSCLNKQGLPISVVLKIVYACDSEYIVESKSIKLYLNSFNMTKLGSGSICAAQELTEIVHRDLVELLETHVSVGIPVTSTNADFKEEQPATSAYKNYLFPTLEKTWNPEITQYSEDPSILEVVKNHDHLGQAFYHSGLLKSNCRVTAQPDWGDVYIMIEGENTVSQESLLKYIVSFRDECHFHEEICETIYKRLKDLLDPSKLVVACLYTRRGGIDINPVRATSLSIINDLFPMLGNTTIRHSRTCKQ